jgi:hypothetical protein
MRVHLRCGSRLRPRRARTRGLISVGPVTIHNQLPKVDRYPSPGQTFVAAESKVLLHHAADTLLRATHLRSRARARARGFI